MKNKTGKVEIFIIRHGEAEKLWDEDADPGLSAKGKLQALESMEELVKDIENKEFQVLSSPLKRALETAAPISDYLNSRIEIDKDFAEIPSPGIPLEQRREWLKKMFDADVRTLEAVQTEWRNCIIDKVSALKKNTIIFSHFMVINCLVGWLEKERKLVNFYPDNCSITKIEKFNGQVSLKSKGEELKTIIQ